MQGSKDHHIIKLFVSFERCSQITDVVETQNTSRILKSIEKLIMGL